MKYLALLSLAAFAVYPEPWVLIPAGLYTILKIGRVLLDKAMTTIANDLHKETWKK